ncbi:MAG: IS66 family insertion sequence element accessory protein TnpB, partial [Rhodospirillales bacterium]|nr:IS66 family insertion sequence element accessory protein TnpB [Rhodospirillales bacterium]
MIPVPSHVRVWLAVGRTDMRRGMNGLALQVQESLKRDPHAGDLYVFRGRSGDLVKIIWHDGLGMSLYAKRLERGRFLWPSPTDGSCPGAWCRGVGVLAHSGLAWPVGQAATAGSLMKGSWLIGAMVSRVM